MDCIEKIEQLRLEILALRQHPGGALPGWSPAPGDEWERTVEIPGGHLTGIVEQLEYAPIRWNWRTMIAREDGNWNPLEQSVETYESPRAAMAAADDAIEEQRAGTD